MKRVSLQQAYVLHRRAYRETSFLVDIMTPDFGRLTVLARGVRKARSQAQGLLQPFIPLLVSWSGKGELMTLHDVEINGEAKTLRGECLFAGFYLNELLMCLLQKWDSHSGIFSAYEKAVSALRTGVLEEKTLRIFEKYLLEELGYGLLPRKDTLALNTLLPDRYYQLVPEQGFVLSDITEPSKTSEALFSGESLLAIMREDWENKDILQEAKRLTRFILAPLLGSRPLFSRRLFALPKEEKA